MFKSDEDFMKALKDPLYIHINEALYRKNQQDKAFGEKQLGSPTDKTGIHPFPEEQPENSTEELLENSMVELQESSTEEQPENLMEDQKVNVELAKTVMEANEKETFGEIEEEESNKTVILGRTVAENCNFKDQRISIISPEVEKALQTLDEVINMMRKGRFNGEAKAGSCLSDEKPPDIEKDTEKNSSTSEDRNVHPKVELFASLSRKQTAERASDEPPRTSSNHSSR